MKTCGRIRTWTGLLLTVVLVLLANGALLGYRHGGAEAETPVSAQSPDSGTAYSIDALGLRYTRPPQWRSLTESERAYEYDATMIRTDTAGEIYLSAYDLWEMTPAEEREGSNKALARTAKLSVQDIANMYSISVRLVERVTVNNIAYFAFDAKDMNTTQAMARQAGDYRIMITLHKGVVLIAMFNGEGEEAALSMLEGLTLNPPGPSWEDLFTEDVFWLIVMLIVSTVFGIVFLVKLPKRRAISRFVRQRPTRKEMLRHVAVNSAVVLLIDRALLLVPNILFPEALAGSWWSVSLDWQGIGMLLAGSLLAFCFWSFWAYRSVKKVFYPKRTKRTESGPETWTWRAEDGSVRTMIECTACGSAIEAGAVACRYCGARNKAAESADPAQ